MQILGTGKQRAGKASKVSITGQVLAFSSWSATISTEDLSTVNFESNVTNFAATGQDESFDEGIHGVLASDATFGGDWDAGTNPFASPPALFLNDALANVLLYVNVTDATYWNYPYFRVRTAQNGGEVKGKVTFSSGGKNQGQFQWPVGSV